MYVQTTAGGIQWVRRPLSGRKEHEMSGNTMTRKLEDAIAKERRRNDAWAGFIEISFQEELDAGVGESIAASKWLQKLTGVST